jgi:hypothetical protein
MARGAGMKITPMKPSAHATPTAAEFIRKVKSVDQFTDEYRPITYTIDGMLPSSSIYGATGKRGSAKTSFLTGVSLAVLTGKKEILDLDVEQGRVAYIILENPTDFRMKLATTLYVHSIDPKDLSKQFVILDMKIPHKEIIEQLTRDANENGPLQLACYDTYQAGFAGAQFNDNADALRHTQDLRLLTELPGKPSVLVACHPVKNASKDNLEPYGGGATMNELDGNLTLWNDNGRIELGWNKVRGPEFDTRYFRIEKLGCPDILDNKGRTPLLPVLRPISAEDVERESHREGNTDLALLQAMYDAPDGTQQKWAAATSMSQQAISKKIPVLQAQKLVEKCAGNRWRLTSKGKREIKASNASDD